MRFKDLFRRKGKTEDSTPKRQKRFFCSNCDSEVFLRMKFCEGCGGEIEWPEEYRSLVDYASKPEVEEEEKELKTPQIPG